MDISKNISNSFVIFIIVVICLFFTVNINLVDITIMEARNFVTAREMLLENNWLMPTFITIFEDGFKRITTGS